MSPIGKGPPGLGAIIAVPHGEPEEDPHEDHDEKHAMCARIAELLGAKLSSTEEEELCDALAAFIDEHKAEEDEEEEGEEEDESKQEYDESEGKGGGEEE
jgi:hypothetical protein